jgi:hypothetical protein
MPAIRAYEKGDKKEAIDQMLQILGAMEYKNTRIQEYKNTIEGILPSSFKQGVVDADSFFKIDLPEIKPLWVII